MSLMGLDLGTTGCKAMVFDTDGCLLSHHYVEYSPVSPTELSPEELKNAAFEVVGKAAAGYDVTSICISSFGESFVLLDEADKPLDNILLYTDTRGLKQCDGMVASHGEERFRRVAGVKPSVMYSLSKLAYYAEEKPETIKKARHALLIAGYIAYLLTGESAIDHSLAARTMAFDIVGKQYDDILLSYAGVDKSLLPRAVQSGSVMGMVRKDIAGQLSLNARCAVAIGGHDQVCAAIGAGVLSPGPAIDGMGTVECITFCFDHPMLTDEFLDNGYACVPYSVPGCYATYAFNFTGGSLLKWYRDTFTSGITELADTKGMSFYAYMDSIGAKEPTDLIVVPHFAGSATPDMNPSAKGVIYGLSFATDNAALYRGLLEGVTLEMVYNLDILGKSGLSVTQLRATGGGAKSKYWLQIKADMTGLPIAVLDVAEAGITGCVMMAGVADGSFGSLEEAAGVFVRTSGVLEPNAANKQAYAEKYEKYLKIRNISAL